MTAETETPIEETTPAETAAPESTEEAEETPAPKIKKGVISFVVNPTTLEVRAYKGVPNFDQAQGEIPLWSRDHMDRLPTPLLVKLYNRIRPERPITKFRDRKAAENTMWPTLEVLGGKPLPGASKTMPAAAKKGARKAAAKKTTTKSSNGGGAGRTSAFSGKTITKLVDKNPRREGTHGFKSFALIKNGMTYEDYIAKGGRRNDLDWDIKHKYVKLNGK